METKSRYQAILEMEDKKRQLITQRDSLDYKLKNKERELKNLRRELEDKEEELQYFKENMDKERETFNLLIKNAEDAIKALSQNNK